MADEAVRPPSRTLAEALDRENLGDPAEREFLIIELRHYLRIVDLELMQVIEPRQNDEEIDAAAAALFFRSKERTENVKQLLQYMISFLKKLPLQADIENDLADPFAQFKAFVRYQIDLLREEDVRDAIVREFQRRGVVRPGNEWYTRVGIVERHEELAMLVESAREPTREDWAKLFLALQRNSRYWFEVRQLDMKRIRKSDVYIYRLSRLLLSV